MPENNRYDEFEAIRRKTDDEWNGIIDYFGMAKGKMMIIWTLYAFGRPCTQKEICDDWYESKQTINSAAKKLEEEGIIGIEPSPDNFREKYLILSEKGKFLAMRTVGKVLKAEKSAFANLSEEEQNEVIRISKKYYELLKDEFKIIKGEKQ